MVQRRTDRLPQLRASASAIKGLSEHRRQILAEDVEKGRVRYGATNYNQSTLRNGAIEAPPSTDAPKPSIWMVSNKYSGGTKSESGTAIAAVAHSSSFLKKQAASISTVSSGGGGTFSSANVERLQPEIYSPLYTMANLNLPRDRITINAWVRAFYDLHPIVRNAITLHATYPISKINLQCEDRKVLQFFEDMVEEMGLMEALGGIALDFWKCGEVFPYAEFDEGSGRWARIIVQNPDYIHVRKSVLSGEPMISMKPDAVLQRLATSSSPADVQLRKQIPQKYLEYIRTGKDIPLDSFNISHLKMLSSPYDIRGTSIIVSIFKDLMLYDKIREAKFAQADGMINPLTVIKVGGNADGDYRATAEDIEFFRQILEEAQYDKDFKLVTHAGVTIERIGFSGQTLDVAADIELIIKNIYTGLMVPPAVIDTESAVYASASIGLEVLRQRYFNFRNMMANWLQNKIFAPIAELNQFYKYEDGEKKLIVPEVIWNQMNLYDLQDYIGNLTGLLAQKQVSLQTLYRSLGLNYEEERVRIRQEMINDAVLQREQASLSQMTLDELRTIDPEKPIQDPTTETEREAVPAAPPSGGLGAIPGGEMGVPGGLPELAPPPATELGPPAGGGTPPLGPGPMPGGIGV